jgi:dephospho-CoA kinase
MRVVGLTGSIGMGKSTTSAMFRARGVPVHDADRAVHRLYSGKAVAPLETAFPGVAANGAIDRAELAERVTGDPEALARLEAIVHPLVRESAAEFLEKCREPGHRLAVLDVPLLLETGGAERVDCIVVVTAAPEIQRARVLARPDMTEAKFAALLARQLPDAEKRRRAHFLVDSGRGFASAGRQVDAILAALAFTV